jgi:hemoglobin-like flavoprotein
MVDTAPFECNSECSNARHDTMLRALYAVAESGVDIVPLFFERFDAACPEQATLFCNRGSAEGLMVNEMLSMLLAQAAEEPWLPTMMRAQINTHHDHGDIQLEQYRVTLGLLMETLQSVAGERWTPAFSEAWQDACDKLFGMISRYY